MAERNYKLSQASVYQLGISLVNSLELIHNSGLVYNDLKPDNILIGLKDQLPKSDSQKNIFEDASMHLVDFGLATKWTDCETGMHIKQSKTKYFAGNIYFSSNNQLEGKTSSRRDDLHSLIYMLIYLLNSASIPLVDEALNKSKDDNVANSIITVYKTKKEKSLVGMCTGRA